MRYLLDTNACVDYLTGRYPGLIDRVQRSQPEDLCLSSIAAAELRYGAEKSAQKERNHALLDVLLDQIECLAFDTEAAIAYGELRACLEQQGQPIGPNDMLIAAHALSIDATVVTDNVREFARVPELALENWR
ncbi:MAG: type II toxin-antitoxin system VapC family toxin [Thermoanaerobaculia bacterium]